MAAAVKATGLHAVMAVDPGGTTGVAAAYVDLKFKTLKETLQMGLSDRKAVEVKGDWLFQAREVHRLMKSFTFTANVQRSLPIDHIHIVIEDFQVRPAGRAGGGTHNLTSVWVAAGARAMLLPDTYDLEWQQPSDAKRLATNERLKMWKLWEVGSEHKRDAWRHFALRVNKLV